MGSVPRYPKWMILKQGDSYDVWKNGRIFSYGEPSVEAAVTRIRRSRHYRSGDLVDDRSGELSGRELARMLTKL